MFSFFFCRYFLFYCIRSISASELENKCAVISVLSGDRIVLMAAGNVTQFEGLTKKYVRNFGVSTCLSYLCSFRLKLAQLRDFSHVEQIVKDHVVAALGHLVVFP